MFFIPFISASFSVEKLYLTIILFCLFASACNLKPQQAALPSMLSQQNLADLFDKKWVLQYVIEDGERTMEYQQGIDKEVWITFSPQLHQEKHCDNYFPDGDEKIPSSGRCFYGYDGCNEFWGIYTVSEIGEFEINARFSTLIGCPIQIMTQINPETQTTELVYGTETYRSDPFNQAFGSTYKLVIDAKELKLFYPSNQQDYLLFRNDQNE
jgi:heat shock protein HslJ